MKGLLLDDRWAPVTSEMGFLETDAAHAARAFAAWQGGLLASDGVTVAVRPVTGSLEQVLSSLLPLTDSETQRHLFIPTRSAWTGYVDNAYRGTDASGAMAYMARDDRLPGPACGRRAPHLPQEKGPLWCRDAGGVRPAPDSSGSTTVRAVSASNDGGRWVFDQFGEPFPFEQREKYQARRVRDRFTFDMLKDYLRHLGLSPFEEDFYLPEGHPRGWWRRQASSSAPRRSTPWPRPAKISDAPLLLARCPLPERAAACRLTAL